MITLAQFRGQPQLWPQLRLVLLTRPVDELHTAGQVREAGGAFAPSPAAGLVVDGDQGDGGASWLTCSGTWELPAGDGPAVGYGVAAFVGHSLLAVGPADEPIHLPHVDADGVVYWAVRCTLTLWSFDASAS